MVSLNEFPLIPSPSPFLCESHPHSPSTYMPVHRVYRVDRVDRVRVSKVHGLGSIHYSHHTIPRDPSSPMY